jgi:hypothetical protein
VRWCYPLFETLVDLGVSVPGFCGGWSSADGPPVVD